MTTIYCGHHGTELVWTERGLRCRDCFPELFGPVPTRAELEAEVARLRRWKAEALQVMDEWEEVWEAAGCPGDLGQSKAAAIREMITRGSQDRR